MGRGLAHIQTVSHVHIAPSPLGAEGFAILIVFTLEKVSCLIESTVLVLRHEIIVSFLRFSAAGQPSSIFLAPTPQFLSLWLFGRQSYNSLPDHSLSLPAHQLVPLFLRVINVLYIRIGVSSSCLSCIGDIVSVALNVGRCPQARLLAKPPVLRGHKRPLLAQLRHVRNQRLHGRLDRLEGELRDLYLRVVYSDYLRIRGLGMRLWHEMLLWLY